jgi:hypothetical protein
MTIKSFALDQSEIDYIVQTATLQGKKQNRIIKEALLLHKKAYANANIDEEEELDVDFLNECAQFSKAIARGEVATTSLKDFKNTRNELSETAL